MVKGAIILLLVTICL